MDFCADYPAALSAILGKVEGAGMLTVFSIGHARNINPNDIKTKPPQAHAEAARIGTVLAGEVIKTFSALRPLMPPVLRVGSKPLVLQPASLKEGDLDRAKAVAADLDAGETVKFLDTVLLSKCWTRKPERAQLSMTICR